MIYKTKGTCSQQISFDVENGIVKNVKFFGGCPGNTKAVSLLCEGRNIDELINTLSGIPCRYGTSCPDQLSQALKKYKDGNN